MFYLCIRSIVLLDTAIIVIEKHTSVAAVRVLTLVVSQDKIYKNKNMFEVSYQNIKNFLIYC